MSTPATDGETPFAGVPDDELVTLDRLGTVPMPTLSGLVVAPGLPEASRNRLAALGDASGSLEITEDLDRVSEARLIILSTRLPRAELTTMAGRLIEDSTCPVIALAHAGGESLAVEVVRRGGLGVLAEGHESAVGPLLTGESSGDLGLLDSYDRQIARTDSASHGTRGRDVVTGLPDGTSLEARLGTLEQDGELPRLSAVRIVRTPMVPEELGEDAAQLVRRRIAIQFRQVARSYDAEIFAVAPWEFVLVGMSLSPNAVQYLGRDLDRIAETYSPTGVIPLGIALGHAGAEVSTDVTALREAAHRALDVAVTDRSQVVVGAEALSLGMSATTELESALQVVAHVERRAGHAPDTSARTGEVAAALATALGYDGIARSRIQLATHLHAVGLATMSAEELADPEALTGKGLQTYRQYPVRSAEYLALSAGPEVATAVHGHRERWDGSGFPDGLAGADIPITARILATARAITELAGGTATAPLRLDEISDALSARAGTELDPDMVSMAVDMLDDLLGAALALAV